MRTGHLYCEYFAGVGASKIPASKSLGSCQIKDNDNYNKNDNDKDKDA